MQQRNVKNKLSALPAIVISWLLVMIIAITLISGCASTPRYTRKNTEIPDQTSHEPHKPDTLSFSSDKQKQTHAIKKVVPVPKKEKPVKKAFAPEMRIPSGPSIQSGNSSYRFTYYQKGKASYYANKFHGRKTANGEQYNQNALTAAHPKLPFNSVVRVTNTQNNRAVIVRINDRGPFVKGRIIDLSRAAAKEIGILSSGVAEVVIEIDNNKKK